MAYALGIRVLKKMCELQDPLAWHRAKLTSVLFKPYELPVFEWVQNHVKVHHALPQVSTLIEFHPDAESLDVPEPISYYVSKLEAQFSYESINKANVSSQEILKQNEDASDAALGVLRDVIRDITQQRYRSKILDVGIEAPALILTAYHKIMSEGAKVVFGWPYLDSQTGGVMAGEVVSIVGRPAAGKTWMTLWTAMTNWMRPEQTDHILFVSMEMETLSIAQRIASVYTKQPIAQLKTSAFSSQTLSKFYVGLQAMQQEGKKFYVIDGRLAANAEDIFMLADILGCKTVFVDGAYLLRHQNKKLDRYTRAAENVELMKQLCMDLSMTTFCSWQFNRQATQKQKKGGGEQAGLEDIGYSDAIGQISSVVLGLFQEEGIETMKERKIRVMKGRGGEIGNFSIAWDFQGMSFAQTDPPIEQEKGHKTDDLEWI